LACSQEKAAWMGLFAARAVTRENAEAEERTGMKVNSE
jgi:hypothetical protein